MERQAELRQLKARYCAAVDKRDWGTFRALFADDCVFTSNVRLPVRQGADAFVDHVRALLGGARSVHSAYLVRIDALAEVAVSAAWSMSDIVEFDPVSQRRGWSGVGTYEETYRLVGGRWLIETWHLERGSLRPQRRT